MKLALPHKQSMKGISTVCLLIILTILESSSWAELIPADRRISWSPGVRGDIPTRATICSTLLPNGSNDTAQIQNALNTCGAGQVVKLNAGTFKISSAIRLPSNVTLRGAGMGTTTIQGLAGFSGNWLLGFENNAFDWSYTNSPSLNLSAGFTKNSTHITTTITHGWAAGDFVLIDQLEDPTGNPPVTSSGGSGKCSWCSRAGGTRPLGQWVKIMAVPTSTTADIDPPLYWNYTASKSPQGVKLTGLTQNAGVEDLTINNSTSDAQNTTAMHFVVNCWLLRVEFKGVHRRMIDTYGGLWNTLRSSKLHAGVPETPYVSTAYGPDRAYGVFLNGQSAMLIEDTIFYDLSLPISLEGGPSGNVIGYNYFTRIQYQDPEWSRISIGAHGAHPMMNLIEGNIMEDKIDGDWYWGTSSHQTYFRNKVTNQLGKTYGVWGIDLYKGAWYYNIIGNVLGTVSYENTYELTGYLNMIGKSIYRLGYFDAGDHTALGNDINVKTTLLRHGNWDSVSQTVRWDPTISDHTLPASYYLTSRPTFLGSCAWPVIGPDLNPTTSPLPAKSRYDGTSNCGSGSGGGDTTPPTAPVNLRVLP